MSTIQNKTFFPNVNSSAAEDCQNCSINESELKKLFAKQQEQQQQTTKLTITGCIKSNTHNIQI